MTAPVRLVVVEDSPVQRDHLREVLEADRQVRGRVRLLAKVTVVAHPRGRGRPRAPDPHRAPPVAIAASTGGPAALAEILPCLDGLAVPVLVVQHLHPQLVDGFVGWMRRVSALPVVVAADGDRPQPGVVYGMPAAARRLGAAGEVVGLGQVHAAIRDAVARLVRP